MYELILQLCIDRAGDHLRTISMLSCVQNKNTISTNNVLRTQMFYVSYQDVY